MHKLSKHDHVIYRAAKANTSRKTNWPSRLQTWIPRLPLQQSLRRQPLFHEVATWALAKRRLSNERRNSILMTCLYPDVGSASDWLKENSNCFWLVGFFFQPIRSTAKIWVETTSSVWNFCARYSDVVLRGLKWRPRETSAVFSGYQ